MEVNRGFDRERSELRRERRSESGSEFRPEIGAHRKALDKHRCRRRGFCQGSWSRSASGHAAPACSTEFAPVAPCVVQLRGLSSDFGTSVQPPPPALDCGPLPGDPSTDLGAPRGGDARIAPKNELSVLSDDSVFHQTTSPAHDSLGGPVRGDFPDGPRDRISSFPAHVGWLWPLAGDCAARSHVTCKRPRVLVCVCVCVGLVQASPWPKWLPVRRGPSTRARVRTVVRFARVVGPYNIPKPPFAELVASLSVQACPTSLQGLKYLGNSWTTSDAWAAHRVHASSGLSKMMTRATIPVAVSNSREVLQMFSASEEWLKDLHRRPCHLCWSLRAASHTVDVAAIIWG